MIKIWGFVRDQNESVTGAWVEVSISGGQTEYSYSNYICDDISGCWRVELSSQDSQTSGMIKCTAVGYETYERVWNGEDGQTLGPYWIQLHKPMTMLLIPNPVTTNEEVSYLLYDGTPSASWLGRAFGLKTVHFGGSFDAQGSSRGEFEAPDEPGPYVVEVTDQVSGNKVSVSLEVR